MLFDRSCCEKWLLGFISFVLFIDVHSRPDFFEDPCHGIEPDSKGYTLKNQSLPGIPWLCCRCPHDIPPVQPCSEVDPASRVCPSSNETTVSVIIVIVGFLVVVVGLLILTCYKKRRFLFKKQRFFRKLSQESNEDIDLESPPLISAPVSDVTLPPSSPKFEGRSAGTSGYASDCEESVVGGALAQRPRDQIIACVVSRTRTLSGVSSISAPDLRIDQKM